MDEIRRILKSIGLPSAYLAFPIGNVPPLPYAVYVDEGSDNFGADNKIYFPKMDWAIELYADEKDPATEKLIRDALSAADIYAEQEETVYFDETKMYQTRFIFQMEGE